ncbi:MAG TPA: AI-2E family transporter [Flavobacteriia bacterium]|jgi:predicted PurR-regulated permease PerM|nr:AI-2E family transporter [Flavobacteriia bacterium]
MRDLKTTNTLLLILVLPIIFYVLKILSFIFVPLVFSMFIALLFLPLMRWLKKKKIPKPVSIFIVILIIGSVLRIGGKLIQLSSKEILATQTDFFEKATFKLQQFLSSIEGFFGIKYVEGGNVLNRLLQEGSMVQNFGSTVDFIGSTLSMTLMTAFFVVLWLGESINFQTVLNNTILKQKHASVKTFMKIENDLIKFIKVKFIISLFTGIGIGLSCYFFDVSFPIFWGLFAFVINFIQMIGSFISVLLVALFAFVELDPTSTLFFFVLSATLVQVVFGGILEPVFMGKSFSINIITILVMLMFWGFIWGIPGMIMAIPITVFLKIILEQFPKTKIIANLIAGTAPKSII